MLASFMGRMLTSMGMEATLAIFGLASLTEATFGTILYWALQYKALTRGLWWWIFSPILIMIILFVSLYIISTEINEYLNPRNRIMRLATVKRPQK
jgi:peptide/nickel transport system permease protein